jgi:uncharacterized protein YggE
MPFSNKDHVMLGCGYLRLRGYISKAALILLALIGLVVGPVCAEVILNGEPDELGKYLSQLEKEVVISGEGIAKSDISSAAVRLSVVTEAKSVSQALQLNQSVRQKFLSELTNYGIKQANIRVDKFSSTPKYGFFGDSPKSYQVQNGLTIEIESETELLQITELADTFSEVIYSELKPSAAHDNQLEQQALSKALSNVLQKKNYYEKVLGLTLYPVEFEEHSSRALPPVISRLNKSEEGSPMGAHHIDYQHAFGESRVSAFITVTFRVVEDRKPEKVKKTSL